MTYTLRIDGAEAGDITRVLGRPSDAPGSWSYVIKEESFDFATEFIRFVEEHLVALRDLGLDRSNTSAWVLYEYDEQCNLEFRPEQMKKLGDAGITLCVSCWQAAM
ncbi:MAG: hypothetical protein AAF735_08595 [Myxococcota bacterium]